MLRSSVRAVGAWPETCVVVTSSHGWLHTGCVLAAHSRIITTVVREKHPSPIMPAGKTSPPLNTSNTGIVVGFEGPKRAGKWCACVPSKCVSCDRLTMCIYTPLQRPSLELSWLATTSLGMAREMWGECVCVELPKSRRSPDRSIAEGQQ